MQKFSLLIFLLTTLFSYSQTITSIRFEGNKKSKEVFLRQNIYIQEGDKFDSLKVEESAQLLRNTNLFFDVQLKTTALSQKKIEVVFILDEVITIFPIIANGGSSSRLNFKLGASDIHFRGRGQTIGFVYQYYDRHSFTFYQITPRHKNNRTGHEVFLGKYSTIEPLYFTNGETVPFNFDNYHISAAGYYWWNRFLVSKVGGMLMQEVYKNRGDDINTSDWDFEPGQVINLFKYQVRTQLELQKTQYHYERRSGIHNLLHAEWIETPVYSDATFLKISNDLKYMTKFGKRHNLILKNTTGVASNKKSPFSPFVIDDFVNVRGIGNRVIRGTGLTSFNSEYLFTVLKHPLCFVQLASFFDLSYIRPPGGTLADVFKSDNTFTTAGFGLRFHSRKWYNTVFRVDYGINLKDPSKGGFVFGLGQYI